MKQKVEWTNQLLRRTNYETDKWPPEVKGVAGTDVNCGGVG
jgi:hypothetical protein